MDSLSELVHNCILLNHLQYIFPGQFPQLHGKPNSLHDSLCCHFFTDDAWGNLQHKCSRGKSDARFQIRMGHP